MLMWLLYTILSGACVAFLTLCMKVALNDKVGIMFATTVQTVIVGICFVIALIATKRPSSPFIGKISTANSIALLLAGILGAAAALFYFTALKPHFAWKVEPVPRI